MVGGVGDVAMQNAPQRVFGNVTSHGVSLDTSLQGNTQNPACPNNCQKGKIYRDGTRPNADGSTTQRWLCTACGARFVDKPLKSNLAIANSRQICAEEAKNLHVPKRKHYGTGELPDETKALITVFEGWLKTQGYAKNCYPSDIKTLAYLGANLLDPEDVKKKIGEHQVKNGTKMLLTYAYEAFLSMKKMSWERPVYKQEEIIPFIPEETELDQLISAAHSKRMAAYLRTMKETFTDPSEALRIQRHDIQGNNITIRYPVKDHRPRTLEVSDQCIAMIRTVPSYSERIFDCAYPTIASSFTDLKRRVAAVTKNDRFNYIEMRSYRHWGGTKIAELSNGNAMTVMKLLGIKRYDNALKYVNIWKLSFKTETEWEYLAVTTPDELKAALLGGYNFVIEKFGASWFRRPKRIAIAGTPIPDRPDELQCPPLESPVNKRETSYNKGLSTGFGDVSRANQPSPPFSLLTICCLAVWLHLQTSLEFQRTLLEAAY